MASQSEVQLTDLLDEDLISPATGFEELTGHRPSPTSCWRWESKGRRGHKLKCVKVLGRTLTSRQEIRRWIAAVETDRIASQNTSKESGERSESTQRELEAAGLA